MMITTKNGQQIDAKIAVVLVIIVVIKFERKRAS